MSRKPEALLWNRMRGYFNGKDIFLERIENRVGTGMPDVNSICGGNVVRIELKAVVALPKRIATRVLGAKGLNQDQKNWHLNYTKHGGDSLILIGVGEGRNLHIVAIPGRYHDEVNEMHWADLCRVSIANDWVELHHYLIGEKE